jgi:hypothetical protein
MVLQAFIERRTQWFYFEPSDYPDYVVSISKAIKNPIIIYEEVEIINDIQIVIGYHEYRQYENKFNEIRDENNNKITDEKYMENYIVNNNKT